MEDIIKSTSKSTFLLVAYGILLFLFNVVIFKIIAMYGVF
jgi:hypothetical protein